MPLKVKILTANELLSTRTPQLLRCETSGSYPPAKIMWIVGNKAIRDASVTVSLIKPRVKEVTEIPLTENAALKVPLIYATCQWDYRLQEYDKF